MVGSPLGGSAIMAYGDHVLEECVMARRRVAGSSGGSGCPGRTKAPNGTNLDAETPFPFQVHGAVSMRSRRHQWERRDGEGDWTRRAGDGRERAEVRLASHYGAFYDRGNKQKSAAIQRCETSMPTAFCLQRVSGFFTQGTIEDTGTSRPSAPRFPAGSHSRRYASKAASDTK